MANIRNRGESTLAPKMALRSAYLALLGDLRGNIALTFGENGGRDLIQTQQHITHCLNTVRRAAYGRDWCELRDPDGLAAVGFREHHSSNPHWHLVVRAPDLCLPALRTLGPTWAKIHRGGAYHLEEISSPDAYSEYVMKEFWRGMTSENPFIYSPGRT